MWALQTTELTTQVHKIAFEMSYNLRNVRGKRVREEPRPTSADETCYICLAGEAESEIPLCQPCSCPTRVHAACQARWQLQSSGRTEERACRFCHDTLPDWKQTLAPTQLRPADPVMVVTLGNQMHRIRVKPGPEGMQEFQKKIRELFSIPADCEFDVTFKCRAPTLAGDTIQLEGMNSFDAATHCASLMAAQRLATHAEKDPDDAPPPSQEEDSSPNTGTFSSSIQSTLNSISSTTTTTTTTTTNTTNTTTTNTATSSCCSPEPANTTSNTHTTTTSATSYNITTDDMCASAWQQYAGGSAVSSPEDQCSTIIPHCSSQ